MGRHPSHLSLEERRKLDKWLAANTSVAEIADRMGRAASMLYRDIRRNSLSDTELNAHPAPQLHSMSFSLLVTPCPASRDSNRRTRLLISAARCALISVPTRAGSRASSPSTMFSCWRRTRSRARR